MSDPDTISEKEINAALLPESQRRGYCLCIHPFMNVINFAGLGCDWCGQPMTDQSYGPEAKAIRSAAVRAAYPEKHWGPAQP